jgi:hypothetical protein
MKSIHIDKGLFIIAGSVFVIMLLIILSNEFLAGA